MFYTILFLMTFAHISDDTSIRQTSFMKLRATAEQSEFLFDVSQDSPADNYKFRAACISGCKLPVYFEEKVGDSPLGIFRASDATGLLFTTWISGSAYRVRVYYFDTKEIRPVLVQSSKSPISVYDGGSSVEIYRLNNSPNGGLHKVTYHWKAGKFSELRRR